MRKELAHGPHLEARDPGRNETRQSGLNDSKNKVTVPTWNAEHYNHPMRPASVGGLCLVKDDPFCSVKRTCYSRPKSSGGIMRLNSKAMAVAFGILWGACVLLVGVLNIIWPDYGRTFLQLCGSIYPGYHSGTGVSSVVIGTIYALVDGCVGGAIFSWLYNWLASKSV
jgi:hypothetical protein